MYTRARAVPTRRKKTAAYRTHGSKSLRQLERVVHCTQDIIAFGVSVTARILDTRKSLRGTWNASNFPSPSAEGADPSISWGLPNLKRRDYPSMPSQSAHVAPQVDPRHLVASTLIKQTVPAECSARKILPTQAWQERTPCS